MSSLKKRVENGKKKNKKTNGSKKNAKLYCQFDSQFITITAKLSAPYYFIKVRKFAFLLLY